MVSEGMLLFLSKDGILEHMKYAENTRLQISILEKSYPEICGKSFEEVMKCKIPRQHKIELQERKVECLSHELYFKSFDVNDKPCREIRKYFPSENSFCYEVLEMAKRHKNGFLYVFRDEPRGVKMLHSSDRRIPFLNYVPGLCLDLEEHSYFADYGFRREDYLRSAIAHLDLSLLFVDEKG